MTFKVKFNFNVKVYPSLSLWICPLHKSPRIVVRISKFGPKCILVLLRSLLILGLIELHLQCHFQIQTCYFVPNFASLFHLLRFVYIEWGHRPWMLHIPHGTAHIRIIMHADRVAPWTVRQSSFISWWDRRRSISRRLGDWHWILQAPIGFRQIIPTSHAAILYANNRQSPKQQ